MKPIVSIQEYDRLAGLVRSAWVSLNQAGDTPDSHRSILSLQAALNGILLVDAAWHTDSTVSSGVARYHHPLLKGPPNAPEVLHALEARAQEIRKNPKAPEENVSDASLAHAAIPILWRMVRGVRHEVRRRRPFQYYVRLAKRTAQAALALALAWALLHLAWFWLPWGCRIRYFASGDATGPTWGWSLANSLNKNYGDGRPVPWMRRNGWSAHWQGVLLVPEDAEYFFYAQCEGGLRLWLDGELLVDHWTSPGWKRGEHAQRHLQAGRHAFRMEFRDRGGPAALRVRWTGGPIPPNTLIGFPYIWKH